MSKFDNKIILSDERHPLLSALLILFYAVLGFFAIGPIVGYLFAMPFFEGGMGEIQQWVAKPLEHPELKLPLFIMQGVASTIGLIVIPIWYLWTYHKKNIGYFFNQKPIYFIPVIITIFAVIAFMGFNAIFIQWNAELSFPGFMAGFEEWARGKENTAAEMTSILTSFDNTWQFLIGLLVIAIIPAIGEEFVFRGFIQNYLRKGFNNIHVSIWLSAFLFSTIHFQFFGFIPRMLLGALFGYIYYWSGNLLFPIIAHAVNNGFTLIMFYLYQSGFTEMDIENTESVPIFTVLTSFIITFGLLAYFRKFQLQHIFDKNE